MCVLLLVVGVVTVVVMFHAIAFKSYLYKDVGHASTNIISRLFYIISNILYIIIGLADKGRGNQSCDCICRSP